MVTPIQIASWLKINKTPYWRIVDAKDAEMIHWKNFVSDKENEISLADSLEVFAEGINVLPDGVYYIFAKAKTQNAEKEITNHFVIGEQTQVNNAFINNPAAGNSIVTALQEQLNRMEHDRQIDKIEQKHKDELREKNEEIKRIKRENAEGKEGKFDKILGVAEGYLPMLLAKFLPAPPMQANNAYINEKPEAKPEELEENQTLITIAFQNIAAAVGGDDEFYNTMLKLGDMAKSSPENFRLYVQYLNNQKNGVQNH